MNQGCQIFRDAICQNGGNFSKNTTKLQKGHIIYQLVVIYSKWPYNIPTLSISRPSKNLLKFYFWFENIQSGNPEMNGRKFDE
jgi:hypothetical protein